MGLYLVFLPIGPRTPMGEDWVNAPAMWEGYRQAAERYTELGLKDNIHAIFHKEGHAILQEDLVKIFDSRAILQ